MGHPMLIIAQRLLMRKHFFDVYIGERYCQSSLGGSPQGLISFSLKFPLANPCALGGFFFFFQFFLTKGIFQYSWQPSFSLAQFRLFHPS
jgi:hypothetical protein